MERVRRRKRNFWAEYFKTFGLRQLVGLVMIACSIALIFGLIFKSEVTLLIAFSVYAAVAFLSVLMSIWTMLKNNRRSPEFKRAMVNLIIMVVILALALFAAIFTGVNGI
jgi:heme A synthase